MDMLPKLVGEICRPESLPCLARGLVQENLSKLRNRSSYFVGGHIFVVVLSHTHSNGAEKFYEIFGIAFLHMAISKVFPSMIAAIKILSKEVWEGELNLLP